MQTIKFSHPVNDYLKFWCIVAEYPANMQDNRYYDLGHDFHLNLNPFIHSECSNASHNKSIFDYLIVNV